MLVVYMTNPRKRHRCGDRGHCTSNKRRVVLAAARKCRQAERQNAHPTGEQSPSAAETSMVTPVETSVATPSETSVPTSHQDQDRPQVLSTDGCRIVNVAELSKAIYKLTAHSASCGGTCFIQGETNAGLAVVFSVVCSKCNASYSTQSSHQITTSDGKKQWAINMAAVSDINWWWGGLSKSNSTLGSMDVPGMNKKIVHMNRTLPWKDYEG